MKKLLFLMAVLFIAMQGFAQQASCKDAAAVAECTGQQKTGSWACPACYKITKEAGACIGDKTAKIQLGTYYCQRCVKASGTDPGACTMCKATTTQMTKKLCWQHKDTGKRTI